MGGTFDPIHRAHLKVARAAMQRGLERVLFVPAHQPPHKSRPDITDPFHRYAMAALATLGEPRMGVTPFEVARRGTSYTIDTVRHFTSPGDEITLIMGTDSLVEIDTWRDCRELLELARVIAYPRPPYLAQDLPGRLPEWIRRKMNDGIVCLEGMVDETSSTEVRRVLAGGGDIADLVPGPVAEYIDKHHLYVNGPEGPTD